MIAIVDYGMCNAGSIQNMLKYLGHKAEITDDAAQVAQATKLILPGVGAFDSGMQNLADKGLRKVLDERVLTDKVPVLGICLGMQLLSERSEEGKLSGLGWLKADTVRFTVNGAQKLRIPHMGWNTVSVRKESKLCAELPADSRFYFVHSYHVVCREPADVLLTTSYGTEFTSAVERGNVYGAQFHPEKSHKFGMQILKNFVERV